MMTEDEEIRLVTAGNQKRKVLVRDLYSQCIDPDSDGDWPDYYRFAWLLVKECLVCFDDENATDAESVKNLIKDKFGMRP